MVKYAELSEKKMAKALKTPERAKNLPENTAKETIRLITNSLGLVAALAWNEVIKEAVNEYIKPIVGGSSGIISLFVYALVVTILVVLITFNLNRIQKKK